MSDLIKGYDPVTKDLKPVQVDADGVVQVNASVSVSAADGAIQDGVTSSIKATVLDLTNSNPLTTALVDANGDQITSFGGGTQYTEDAVAAANPVGTALMLIREDARAGGLTTTDGDNVAARGNNKGELYVKHTDVVDIQAEEQVDYDTGGGTVPVSLMGIALPGAGGPVAGGTSSNPVRTDPTGTTAQPVTDNGGSITVDGALTSVATITNVVHVDDNASTLSVDDGGSSLTVDGTVEASNFPATVDTNSGNKSASTLRVVIATDQPALTNKLLVTPDANSAVNVAQVGGNNVSTSANGVQNVTVIPGTANGWSIFNATSGDGSTALTNSAQAIKGAAGQLGGWYIFNPNTVAVYVPIYNVAAASVTVGTTNPAMVLTIPAGGAANLELVNGLAFSTAISAAAVMTTAGGNTAPTTAIEANFWYK